MKRQSDTESLESPELMSEENRRLSMIKAKTTTDELLALHRSAGLGGFKKVETRDFGMQSEYPVKEMVKTVIKEKPPTLSELPKSLTP